MSHHRALRHYQTAIQALSDDQYGTLTDRERQSLIRVLRNERRRLLLAVAADDTDRPPSRPRSPRSSSSRSPTY